jgi:hypothetical protein
LDGATRAVLAAEQALPAPLWKRVLEVRDPAGRRARPYLVFNLHRTYFCYSAQDGSRRIWPADRSPAALARAIAPAEAATAAFVPPAALTPGR